MKDAIPFETSALKTARLCASLFRHAFCVDGFHVGGVSRVGNLVLRRFQALWQ